MASESGTTILIVDNDAAVRRTLTKIVETLGYRAVAVDRATRAAGVLAEQPISAMLLDLHMPGPHGDDLLRHLRKQEKRRGVRMPPTIVVSGFLERERLRDLLRLGVSGVVAKPFDVSRVTQEVSRALADGAERRAGYCTLCGQPVCAGVDICSQCDQPVHTYWICPQCGVLNQAGVRFCSQCGKGAPEERRGIGVSAEPTKWQETAGSRSSPAAGAGQGTR